eukprot:2801593-Rhodomonas_salina.2
MHPVCLLPVPIAGWQAGLDHSKTTDRKTAVWVEEGSGPVREVMKVLVGMTCSPLTHTSDPRLMYHATAEHTSNPRLMYPATTAEHTVGIARACTAGNMCEKIRGPGAQCSAVSYTHLRAHETEADR